MTSENFLVKPALGNEGLLSTNLENEMVARAPEISRRETPLHGAGGEAWPPREHRDRLGNGLGAHQLLPGCPHFPVTLPLIADGPCKQH